MTYFRDTPPHIFYRRKNAAVSVLQFIFRKIAIFMMHESKGGIKEQIFLIVVG